MFEAPPVDTDNVYNTDKLSIVAVYIKNLLETTQGLFEDVWFGDQELIPRYPSCAVDPIQLERTFDGFPFQTVNNHTVFLHIYHGRIADTQETDLQCVQFAEQVVDLLHEDPQLGGLVIQGFCKKYEMGQAVRNTNQLLRATRITWEGISKTGVGQ